MKIFLHRYITKFNVVALFIAGIVLLCSVNSVSSVAVAREVNVMPVLNHSADMNDVNSDSAATHSEFGSHIAISTATFNYSAVLFFAVFAIFAFFSRRLSFLANNFSKAKLNYWRHRYRVTIKPKLETILHRWLNLLGGSVAFSF